MSSSSPYLGEGAAVPTGYRLVRGLVRIWFNLFFRKIRVLHPEGVPSAEGPTILLISHPASFLDALILAATFSRQVHCLLDRKQVAGPLRRLLARGLSIILYESQGEGWRSALGACSTVLARREAIVVFAEAQGPRTEGDSRLGLIAARIALEAETSQGGRPGVKLIPVHLFLPVERPQSGELLIYVGAPLSRQENPAQSSGPRDPTEALAAEVDGAFRENVFRLRQSVFERFLTDFEEVLREDLEDDWAGRPGWKQKAKGFELSRFAAECGAQLNYLNPGRLVALREFLDAYLEARRRWSLVQLEVEITGAWLKSPWRRWAVWLESSLVFPIACYGLINHLPSGLVLFAGGLLKKESGRDRRVEWIARGLVVLACYAGQILLSAHWLGRRAAGLYAPTLPLSGAVMWRASWLFRRRTRLALLSALGPQKAGKLRRTRKELLMELERVVQAYAETLGVAH